jgi:uncharacterized protein with PQ loop repeat
MNENIQLIILPYTAVFFSIIARLIFIYLLYSKKSTNIYSLTFCCLSVTSSSIWIPYGILVNDVPIIVRSGVEILLLSVSGLYIIRNRSISADISSPDICLVPNNVVPNNVVPNNKDFIIVINILLFI